VEYDGSAFCGWQSQPRACGVQDALDRALTGVASEPVVSSCAGRTDAGVHALAQVVHFDTAAQRPLSAWTRGTNALLPEGVAVTWARQVPDEFHARFSATGRRYVYRGVPADVAAAFKQAFSKGIFFNREIRDRYAYHETPHEHSD